MRAVVVVVVLEMVLVTICKSLVFTIGERKIAGNLIALAHRPKMCARATPAPRSMFSQRALHRLQLILLILPKLNMLAFLFCCARADARAKRMKLKKEESLKAHAAMLRRGNKSLADTGWAAEASSFSPPAGKRSVKSPAPLDPSQVSNVLRANPTTIQPPPAM